MKHFTASLILFFSAFAGQAQTSNNTDSIRIVETACGQCKFGMTDAQGCDLAIRIDGVPYFVKGTSIDKHGDAHADDGFCNAIRSAKVSGKIEGKNFVATSFSVLPAKQTKP